MLMTAVVFAAGCKKDNDNNNSGDNSGGGTDNTEVKVTTYTPQDITQTTAKCGGDVIAAQGLSLDELGVCWSTSSNPTAADSHLSTANWSETFVCTITSLEPNTKYHVRAYALRGLEYYYGEDKSFTTLEGGGGTYNGHEYVDLGLPSGTLWATCNVGATMPEGYGDYFAWGETQPKDTYDWSNYQYCNGGPSTLTKYCSTDNLTTLLPEDDAATANWGSSWRMPSIDQWAELYDNTTNIWTTRNSVSGWLFTSSNGGSLFLPAAGSCSTSSLDGAGDCGYYWSSSLYIGDPYEAWDFHFFSDYADTYYNGSRYRGFSVRPVREN